MHTLLTQKLAFVLSIHKGRWKTLAVVHLAPNLSSHEVPMLLSAIRLSIIFYSAVPHDNLTIFCGITRLADKIKFSYPNQSWYPLSYLLFSYLTIFFCFFSLVFLCIVFIMIIKTKKKLTFLNLLL